MGDLWAAFERGDKMGEPFLNHFDATDPSLSFALEHKLAKK